MESLYRTAAGIDVHRDTVVVSIRRLEGKRERIETRTFETFHDSLLEMAAWLKDNAVEVVGLESTGVYWKPVVRTLQLELQACLIWLVNPMQVKKVPGRKTDVTDSQWLSKLVMHGLVSPSYLPSPEQEEFRKLTRFRTTLVADQTRCKNRLLKELEYSGIKLSTVCSDVLGRTGRALLEGLLEDTLGPDEVAARTYGQLRKKIPQLRRAVIGSFSAGTRFVLRQLLCRWDEIARDIAEVDAAIAEHLSRCHADDAVLVKSLDGIDDVGASAVLAEMGADMSRFPSADHLAAWSGLSPGSHESAGKSKSVPARKGDKYLRTILVQCAWAAVRRKNTFWARKFRQLVRRGPKKAIVAIARKMLVVLYKILRDRIPYSEPKPVAITPTARARVIRRCVQQLEKLGFRATLESLEAAGPTGTVS